MTRNAFSRLKTKIKSGDRTAFEWLLERCGQKCVHSLIKNTACSEKEAEDILMDALFQFRDRVCKGKITYVANITKYMKGRCWAIWRDRLQAKERINPNTSIIKRSFFEMSLGDPEPLDWNKVELETEARYINQLEATHKSLSLMDEKSIRLLTLFYIFKRKPEEIARILKFPNSREVELAKTTCFKQFMRKTALHLETENG